MKSIIICLLIFGLVGSANAGIYKWTDRDGKVHFTDDHGKIPIDQVSPETKKALKKDLIKKKSELEKRRDIVGQKLAEEEAKVKHYNDVLKWAEKEQMRRDRELRDIERQKKKTQEDLVRFLEGLRNKK